MLLIKKKFIVLCALFAILHYRGVLRVVFFDKDQPGRVPIQKLENQSALW